MDTHSLQTTAGGTFESVITEFYTDILVAIPNLLSGVVFLVLAYISIKIISFIVQSSLTKIYPADQRLVVDLIVVIVGLFLWFGATLGVLKIVGMGDIAASLGTSAGFIGLGLAFALKNMIADTVAGVYLLRDPDFNTGERVSTQSISGTIANIDLRKTRIRTDDGDLVVLANSDVEEKWTQLAANNTN